MAHLLLTNDDGIDAPGIEVSRDALADVHAISVIAPLTNRSATGHAISLAQPIRVYPRPPLGNERDRIAVDGTPADTMKYALKNHLPALPDLVVSGVNNGLNLGVNVMYSGTVAAALEAVIHGVPAVAVSVENYHVPDWEEARRVLPAIVDLALTLHRERPPGAPPSCLNVNIPDLPAERIRGIRFTHHGHSGFDEVFIPRPDGADHHCDAYELSGHMVHRDTDPDADSSAVRDGYVSVTPLQIDMTSSALLRHLRTLPPLRPDSA